MVTQKEKGGWGAKGTEGGGRWGGGGGQEHKRSKKNIREGQRA